MSTEEVKVVPLHIAPEPPTPPIQNISLRVIVQGEVDKEVPSDADESALARAIANDIKTKSPDFKITRILTAHGAGPIVTPL